jgi:hypothetical protein
VLCIETTIRCVLQQKFYLLTCAVTIETLEPRFIVLLYLSTSTNLIRFVQVTNLSICHYLLSFIVSLLILTIYCFLLRHIIFSIILLYYFIIKTRILCFIFYLLNDNSKKAIKFLNVISIN